MSGMYGSLPSHASDIQRVSEAQQSSQSLRMRGGSSNGDLLQPPTPPASRPSGF